MGLHGGAAEQRDGDYHGYLTLARVQRVMSLAHGGQVLLTQTSTDLTRDFTPEGLEELTRRQNGNGHVPMRPAPRRRGYITAVLGASGGSGATEIAIWLHDDFAVRQSPVEQGTKEPMQFLPRRDYLVSEGIPPGAKSKVEPGRAIDFVAAIVQPCEVKRVSILMPDSVPGPEARKGYDIATRYAGRGSRIHTPAQEQRTPTQIVLPHCKRVTKTVFSKKDGYQLAVIAA